MNYIDRRAVTSMTPTLVIQKDRCRADDVTLAPEKSVFYRGTGVTSIQFATCTPRWMES